MDGVDMEQLKLLLDGKNDVCNSIVKLAEANTAATNAIMQSLLRIEEEILADKRHSRIATVALVVSILALIVVLVRAVVLLT